MKFLIKMLAKLIARKVERGSTAGAWIGTIAGLIAGIGLVLAMQGAGWVDSAVAPAIALSMGLMIAGALLGSMLGPRRSPADGAAGPGTVRLTRYNKGLVPSFFVAASIGLMIAVELAPPSRGSTGLTDQERLYNRLAFSGAALIALIVQVRTVLWIEIGSDCIIVGRLIGSRMYSISEIERAALVGGAQGDDLFLASGDAGLGIRFRDGRSYSVGVGVERVHEVRSALARAGVKVPASDH